MSTELQHLLDKIQTEGIAKARAEADALLAQARAEARDIVAAAQREATEHAARAEQEAQAFRQRAAEAVRQAGRNVMLDVSQSVQKMVERLLLKEARAALALPEVLQGLVCETVKGYLAQGETRVEARLPKSAEALLPALRERLRAEAAQGKVEVALDAGLASGFSVRTHGGRVEHDFSAEAVAREMSRSLRPELAALLRGD